MHAAHALLSKNCMSLRNIFDYLTVDVLSKLNSALGAAGWAYPSTLAGEGDKK